ncbi:DNA polymerase alpha-associated dna helicase a, partial [Globisporangium splendens]
MIKPSVAARSLDNFLVPGMLDSTISDALVVMKQLCEEMKESRMLCLRVYDRFLFLRKEVENKPIGTRIQSDVILRYGACVGEFVRFLQKHVRRNILSRIAANRRILDTIKKTHQELDHFFIKVYLGSRPEMTTWKDKWASDVQMQLQQLDDFLTIRSVVDDELAGCSLEEPLTEMKYEFEMSMKSTTGRSEAEDLMVKTIYESTQRYRVTLISIPLWYISRDDVQYKPDHFGIGAFGAVHRGTLVMSRAKVVVKCMYSESKETQDALIREATLWFGLKHVNVLTLYGACHVGKPMFLVTEDVGDHRCFAEYFVAEKKKKSRMWSLFLEAAEGLLFLHSRGIVHNNLKGSNILVGTDGKAKLSDFGFSFRANNPAETRVPRQSTGTRWKAPELFTSKDSSPTFWSDIYSLGMCMIEAENGKPPWDNVQLDKAIIHEATTSMHSRPKDWSEKQWDLVSKMCAKKPADRPSLPSIIAALRDIATNGDEARQSFCSKCRFANPAANKFSSNMSSKTTGEEDDAVSASTMLKLAQYSTGLFGRTVVKLAFPSAHVQRAKPHQFTVGDLVQLRIARPSASSSSVKSSSASGAKYPTGIVARVEETALSITLSESDDVDEDELLAKAVTIDRLVNNATFVKLSSALDRLAKFDYGAAQSVVEIVFSGKSPSWNPLPEITPFNPGMNESQLEAIRFALASKDLALIHGPPGTGKTTTVVELIRQAVTKYKMKVLVCAPSNIAVDNVLEKLATADGKLQLTRIGHPARLLPQVLKYCLDAKIEVAEGTEIVNDIRKEMTAMQTQLQKTRDKSVRFNLRHELKVNRTEIRQREQNVVQELVRHSDVVFATNVGVGSVVLDSNPEGEAVCTRW